MPPMICRLCLLLLSYALSQDLVPLVKEIGGTFCKLLAIRGQIPRNFHDDCELPTCNWNSWQEAKSEEKNKEKVRYVVSYGHNGLGNQLWEHTVAFMIAESLKARLYIAIIPDTLSPDGATPPNTFTGMNAMERLLPPQFLYDKLPLNSSIRQLCDQENFFISDRPRDWRNGSYSSRFKSSLYDLIVDPNPRCLKMLGYFQNLPLCADDAVRLWTPRIINDFPVKPGLNDISIYLRCIPRHYYFNNVIFYETILNNTKFDRVWLFQAPECPTRLSKNPATDGPVAAVIRLLTTRFNATRWPSYNGTDETAAVLHDLSGLAQSKKIILPASSWAQWAGFLSNSTEIHVNTPPLHMVMSEMPQYIYHDERGKRYFGRYNITTKDLDFAMLPPPPPPEQDLTVPPAGAKTNSSITNAGNVTKPII